VKGNTDNKGSKRGLKSTSAELNVGKRGEGTTTKEIMFITTSLTSFGLQIGAERICTSQ
jgi:hypothetical protein